MSSVENYWDNIGKKVLDELERRLEDENDARELPGAFLMRLAEKYIQYLEKKLKAEQENEVTWLTPLEAIDQEGLPDITKLEILNDYIGRLQTDLLKATNLKEALNGAKALHEPQASV